MISSSSASTLDSIDSGLFSMNKSAAGGASFDYQQAYEMMKKENEMLTQTLLRINREMEEASKVNACFFL